MYLDPLHSLAICRLVVIVVFVLSRVIMKFNLQVLYSAIAYRGVDSFTFFGQRSPVSQYSTSIGSTCRFKVDEFQNNRYDFQLQMSADQTDFVKADDGEALQELFSSYCDKDGLMTKNTLKTEISVVKELLVRGFVYFLSFDISIFHIRISSYHNFLISKDVGDLLEEEFNDIWEAAPKFPDINAEEQRIDVDSFIQIYRDIDDIFEDDEEDDDSNVVAETSVDNDVQEDENDDEVQLERTFKTICNNDGLVSKDALMKWSEIKELLDDNELGQDEFDDMWQKTPKSPGSDLIDVDGFLSFNVALDSLFEVLDFEDESIPAKQEQIPMFYADDLPPGVIFAEIANDNTLVGMEDLKKWGDLQDMLREGDLLPLELQNMFENIPKADGTDDQLDEEGFTALYDAIDDLFEEDGEEDDNANDAVEESQTGAAAELKSSSKDRLFEFFSSVDDEDRLPCGLEATDNEVELVLDLVSALEKESQNMVLNTDGEIQLTDVEGDWELLYTTSSTMKFNKSLSGLVPPNGKFGGLVQKLKASKYLADVEYVEQINAGPASFEVKVTGDWELRSTVSLFTGSKSVCLDVVPDKVNYGLNSQKADHWKTLGVMNLLDITYLDDDMRVMRGTTSTDSIFIFKKL